ncbi:MAG: membrane protein insertase YidC [Alistipes sp.]|jgi:YidC/Oxa1 family membrane protein insertase|nr:membrane protein insertase YidC [Alistipes sp.]
MNKQTLTGFLIIGAILFGFSWYQGQQQSKLQEQQRIADSIALANAPAPAPVAPPATAATADTLAVTQADPLGETMANARTGDEQRFTIENDVATFEFSTRGGIVSDVTLKDYKRYGGGELHLWKRDSERFDISFFLRRDGRDAQVNTRDFLFTPTTSQSGDDQIVTMRLPVDSTACVEFIYTIPRSGYMIDYDVRFTGMDGRLSNQSSFDIEWGNTSLQNEKGFDNENNYTTIAYNYPGVKGIEQMGAQRAGGTKTENEPSRVQWVAFKQQFFSSILIADDAFQGADLEMSTFQPTDGTIKRFHTRTSVPMERDRDTYGFRMYFGPNQFSTLKEHGTSLERIVPLGGTLIGWVGRLLVIPIFDWLGTKGLSFGLIILILTLIIKTVTFPLTFTSYKSSAKMRVIKPETDEINAQYPDPADAMKKQQATMELYRRAGINPLAGCIPMLIQMPFLIAMFRFFPAAIELRGQSLWWADDLSSYDSIINLPFDIPFYGAHISLFALLTAVAIHFTSRFSLGQQSAGTQMAGMKFISLYMMPVMMLLWFNNFAAGLNFYYFISTLFSLVQMYGVRLLINEGKLRRRMLETPRKEKKKSGFMQRLEEAQKAQLAAARAQQEQTRGGSTPPPTRGSRGNLPGNRPKKK